MTTFQIGDLIRWDDFATLDTIVGVVATVGDFGPVAQRADLGCLEHVDSFQNPRLVASSTAVFTIAD